MNRWGNQKPENTLKRADELCSLGQHSAALSLLLEFILSKRFRATPVPALDPLMASFISLAVLLRKGKSVKEALHQYKNVTQNTVSFSLFLILFLGTFQKLTIRPLVVSKLSSSNSSRWPRKR